MAGNTARIAVTVGEPAGIGPDIVLELATRDWPAELVVIGDIELLRQRATELAPDTEITEWEPVTPPHGSTAGKLTVLPVPLATQVTTGTPDPANAAAVLEMLTIACNGCLDKQFAAMVTAPVQKSVINDAGIAFSGHTEFLAELCGDALPVMMLASAQLRVALVTTHLPLRAVPDAVTAEKLTTVISTTARDLQQRFGLAAPRIAVLGLNPHAGESGHLGNEERDVIEPVLQSLRSEGLNLIGPLPADTAFTQKQLSGFDAVIAMYHDQGLPVVKHAGFGEVVNITLGLPVIRTSVDHGTALDLAGSGTASAQSLFEAVDTAIQLADEARPS